MRGDIHFNSMQGTATCVDLMRFVIRFIRLFDETDVRHETCREKNKIRGLFYAGEIGEPPPQCRVERHRQSPNSYLLSPFSYLISHISYLLFTQSGGLRRLITHWCPASMDSGIGIPNWIWDCSARIQTCKS